MNFFTKIILGTVLVLVAATAVILLARSREPARVEALLREAAGWAEQGDADRLAALVDDEYEGGADEMRRSIREHLSKHDYEKVDVRDVEVTVTGDEARAKISAGLLSAAFPYPIPRTFLVRLRKRESGWRVVRVEQVERREAVTQ